MIDDQMNSSRGVVNAEGTSRLAVLIVIGLLLSASFGFAFLMVKQQSLVLITLGLSLFTFASIWKQNWLVYAFLIATTCFYDYWNYTDPPLLRIGYNVYMSDLFILFMFFATMAVVIVNKGHEAFRSKLGIAVSLYVGWILFEILRGIPKWGGSALGESRFVILACIYFPLVHSIKTFDQFKRLITISFFLIFGFIIYVQLWRFFIQFDGSLALMLHNRLMGADMSLLAASIFVFCLVLLLDGVIKKHKFFFLSVIVFLGFLIPLGARTGFIAWLIGIIFVLIRKYKTAVLKPRLSFILIFFVLGVFYWNTNVLSPEEMWDPTAGRTFSFLEERQTGEGTSSWRLAGWAILLDKTLQGNIVFGEGLGGYYDIFDVGEKIPPHNEWLMVFNKLGLVGLALLFYLVFQFYKTGNEFIKSVQTMEMQATMEGLFAVFLVGLVGGVFFAFFPFVWIIVGLQSSLINAQNL